VDRHDEAKLHFVILRMCHCGQALPTVAMTARFTPSYQCRYLNIPETSRSIAWCLNTKITFIKILTQTVFPTSAHPISRKIWQNSARTLRSGCRCPQSGATPIASKLYGLNFFSRHEPVVIISTVRSDSAFSTDVVKPLLLLKR
jgi:hypothetical protein